MTQADTQRDPFIECYRAWLKQKAFSTGTGADILASFSNTSGLLSIQACSKGTLPTLEP